MYDSVNRFEPTRIGSLRLDGASGDQQQKGA